MAVYPYTLMCENYPVQYSGKDEGDVKQRIKVFEFLKKCNLLTPIIHLLPEINTKEKCNLLIPIIHSQIEL